MKKSQKGFIVPLLIAIIAVLVVGGGVYVYEQNKSQPVIQVATNNQPSIISLSPSSASIDVVANNTGINATITGTGFLPTGNTVLFGNNSASGRGYFVINNLPSSDGKTIQFSIPMDILYGVSPVRVRNSNGTTNSADFTLTPTGTTAIKNSSQSSLVVLSPNGGETIVKGQSLNVTWKASPDLADALINVYITAEIGVCKIGSANGSTGFARVTLQNTPNCLISTGSQQLISLEAINRSTGKVIVSTNSASYFTVVDTQSITTVQPSLNNQTYTNSQYGLSMNYQSGIVTKIPYTWSQSAISAVGTPIVEIPVVAGSFDSGLIDIGMSTDSGNVSNCLTVPTDTEVAFQNASDVSINGVTFLHFSRYSPAAGQFRNTDAYHTIKNGACWSIDLSVDGEETNRLDASQVPLANADFTHIQSELNANLQTFRFLR